MPTRDILELSNHFLSEEPKSLIEELQIFNNNEGHDIISDEVEFLEKNILSSFEKSTSHQDGIPVDIDTKSEFSSSSIIDKQEKKNIKESTKRERKLAILNYIFHSMIGKDKLAKIIIHLLSLIDILTIKKLLPWINTSLFPFNVKIPILQLERQRRLIAGLLRNSHNKISSIVPVLSTFRYILRLGHSIPNSIKLMEIIKRVTNKSQNDRKFKQLLQNTFFLRGLIDAYFTIFDELILLFDKFKVLRSLRKLFPRYKLIIGFLRLNHTIAWQLDIIYNLVHSITQLQRIKRNLFILDLESTIRKAIIKDSLQNGVDTVIKNILSQLLLDLDNTGSNGKNSMVKRLMKGKRLIYMELLRLFLDGCANTIHILALTNSKSIRHSVPYNLLSLTSGIVGLLKLFGNVSERMSFSSPESSHQAVEEITK
ncbi:uncharacterized protein NDAI_0C05870 [Naumovozyma dairenensis CBS 421]|uniref:Uncharacterized protein n=1 Tax=Naumovozyma dairenensis (strain ATCC 10597 / BCRC 20456 / CBS 421 / NBRC 0211 / NRRL Y-12639) TaxID=1071378 RepID=G0W8Y5_NAUDC|nr:hypothetical protein NDAI_0C05870 [Naumovozyma dairenensis CBS 421]CCD24246.1 hypothetical protein NDAI_0C05870 [Naumovozyma dairenensis CBS 421]